MKGAYLTKSEPEPQGGLRKFAPPERGDRLQSLVKFRAASQIELAALGEKPAGFIAGWASTPDLDSYNHRVTNGAFTAAIAARGLTGPRGIKLLLGHNWNQLAGVIEKLEYRTGGLWIEAQLNLEIGYVKNAYIAAKMVDGLSFSVGFMLEEYAVKGNEEDGEWLQIDKGDLYEVSVVPFPGNDAAEMLYIKNSPNDPPMAPTVAQFEKWLVACGLVKSRNQAKSIVQEAKGIRKLRFSPDPSCAGSASSAPVLATEKVAEALDAIRKARAALET